MKLELRMASRQTLTRQMAQERAAEKNLERGAQAQEEVGRWTENITLPSVAFTLECCGTKGAQSSSVSDGHPAAV